MERNNVSRKLMTKIAVLGPESTGKTTLTKSLASYFKTNWVPEFARSYLDKFEIGTNYSSDDILKIAQGQLELEKKQCQTANQLIFCDTEFTVLKIWFEHKFGKCAPFIQKQFEKQHYDLYLLAGIDAPWQADPQRENPKQREYFYNLFKKRLLLKKANFIELVGDENTRFDYAIRIIKNLVASN